MHSSGTPNIADSNHARKGDVPARTLRMRDTTRVALAASLVVVAGFAAVAGGSTQVSQPPDPATVIPGPTHSEDRRPGATQRESARRDTVRWPTRPTARDLRVRGVNVRKFLALGRCEAGPGNGHGGIRFRTPSGWKWQGAYGLYYRTHQSVGHPYGADAGQMTWQEQTLVAQRVMERYGIRAWSAAHCYTAA